MTIAIQAPSFRRIPQFTQANYAVDVAWSGLEDALKGWQLDADTLKMSWELNPDFQRGHVWDIAKRVRFVEFVLRGGRSANSIFFNCPGWQQAEVVFGGRFVLVDGKQRMEAVRAFLRDEFPAFGFKFSEYKDRLPMHAMFKVHINSLRRDADVLQWYLDMNDGGVVHSEDELSRVRAMLAKAQGEQ